MAGSVGRLRRFGTVGAVLLASLVSTLPGGGAAATTTATLRVTVEGEGQVYSPHRLVSCTSSCAYRLGRDRVLTLGVNPAPHFSFEGWGGTCVGDGPECTVAADAGGTVRAVFHRLRVPVSLVVSGSGTVVSSPAGLACGMGRSRCEADVGEGAPLLLRAEPAPGYRFGGWSGACGGDRPACRVVPVDYAEAGAVFRSLEPQPGRLSVSASARGFPVARLGLVQSAPAGIDCPPTCVASFPAGTRVTLRTPFLNARWGGACVGAATECPLIVDAHLAVAADVTVAAHTRPPPAPAVGSYGLNVTVSGKGTVTDGRRIRCGVTARTSADCRALYRYGEVVVLRAVARTGARFGGWGGFCRGPVLTCRVRATAAKTVTAFFRRR